MGGLFWLLTAVTGTLAMVAYQKVVAGDAAARAANIIAQEPLFRAGIVANLIAAVCYTAATVFVYALLKPVNRNVSLLAAFFSLAGCAGGAVTFVSQLAPLIILRRPQYLSAFNVEQLQALALMFLDIGGQAFLVVHAFFGMHCLLVGLLILKATFLPRFVGALMVIAGSGWLMMSFTNLLSPAFAQQWSTMFMAAGGIGELTLSFWLLVMGVNAQRWKEQASLVPSLATEQRP